jgi:hypothetical protein
MPLDIYAHEANFTIDAAVTLFDKTEGKLVTRQHKINVRINRHPALDGDPNVTFCVLEEPNSQYDYWKGKQCAVCGQPATGMCLSSSSPLMCGTPLCIDHHCPQHNEQGYPFKP